MDSDKKHPYEFHHVKKDSIFDKEIEIRVKPIGLVKLFFLMLILILVFFMGRWSVEGVSFDFNFTSGATQEIASKAETSTPAPSTTATTTATAPIPTETPAPAAATDTTADTTPIETSDEPTITTYTKVDFSITSADRRWLVDWGKITNVGYLIKNNEAGIIKPDHIIMNVKGYADYDKKIPIPASHKLIKAGQERSVNIMVPKGFAYNEVSVGDLKKVEITLELIDVDGKLIKSVVRVFDLSG